MATCIAPRAMVMQSGQCQHSAERKIFHPRVESRRLMRCDVGRGQVVVNGETYDLFPRSFLFLPWGHSIRYLPDPEDPFTITGVHVIPDYDQGEETLRFAVAHGPAYEYFGVENRRDVDLPGIDGVLAGILDQNAPLSRLLDYIVCWFHESVLEEEDARSLGRLLINEVVRFAAAGKGIPIDLPKHLWEVVRHIDTYLDEPLPLERLTKVACCSRATLSRQFKQYLKLSPGDWIIRRRVDFACHLLKHGTQRISEVGTRVGFDNPYYFSRIFRKTIGVSPSEYRKKNVSVDLI